MLGAAAAALARMDSSLEPKPMEQSSWLSRHTRPLLLLGLCGIVCGLAVMGVVSAQTAIIDHFPILIAYLFGEKAALKRPGQDT